MASESFSLRRMKDDFFNNFLQCELMQVRVDLGMPPILGLRSSKMPPRLIQNDCSISF